MSSSGKPFCFRILVLFITVLIWLIGAAVLGFSIYLRVDYWINQYVGANEELAKYTVFVYVFIAGGALTVLFGIVGIYGAARPDKLALIVYLIFLPIILGSIVGGGVYAYIYREEIENTVMNSQLLTDIVQKKYDTDDRVSLAIDYMQRELKCCGGRSYTDYSESIWSSNDPSPEDKRKNKVPATCCSDYWKYKDIHYDDYKYCSIYVIDPEQVGGSLLGETNPNVYKLGCGEAFVKFVQENITIAAAIAFSVVGLLVLAIIFVSLLLFYLRKSPAPREDDVVYEMARTQEKSPYPARGGPYANLYQS